MVSLLLIGDLAAAAPRWVTAFADPLQVTRARDLDDAAELLADAALAPPDLLVLAEVRRGEFSHASLAALRKQAPLVRVWRMLGSWCEGESRSGRPPDACGATYWHRWEAQFAGQMEIERRGGHPAWDLPLTATHDERILAATGSSFAPTRSGLILICATSATAAESIGDLCCAAGYDTLVVAQDGRFRARGAAAIVWDTTVERIVEADRVAELRGMASGAPLVASVGFPRVEDVESARRAGAAAVVSKPFLAGDLLWHLDRVVCQS